MELLLANPRGFCAGVDRAIEMVERALTLHGAPIYVRHEVVHNEFVVANLRKKAQCSLMIWPMCQRVVSSFLAHMAYRKRYDTKRRHAGSRYSMQLARW